MRRCWEVPPCRGGRRKSLPAFPRRSRADVVGFDWSASHPAITVAEAGPMAAEPALLGELLVAHLGGVR